MPNRNNNQLPNNLPQLQNLIKADSASYCEEFERQFAIYQATKLIFLENPAVYNESLYHLVNFLAYISECYTETLKDFPNELVNILRCHGPVLHPLMRLAFAKALIFLRNKNLVSPTSLIQLFFRLLQCQDKNLRKFLQVHMVNDIKNINQKRKNMKLNKELQNYMLDMLQNNHALAVKTALDVMISLYKKLIWNDAKTVNIIVSACFSKITKVMVAAINFFVGIDEKDDSKSDSESEDELPNLKKMQMAARVGKSKRSYIKKEEKAKQILRKKKNKTTKEHFDFSAIHLIHDPQAIADKLFKKLSKMHERFEVKLVLMNFISRLIGIHELYLPSYYSFLQRYLFVHQRDVTKIMTYAAQASHQHIPPDDLEPVVKTLANNFVTERYSGEVMAMGLNAIRELCARNHHCMNEELLQDLVAYKSHKEKSVSLAAHSLITLFRELNPHLLGRKYRGAPSELSKEMPFLDYGQNTAKDFISGAEVLTLINEDENADNDDWAGTDSSDGDDDTGNSKCSKSKAFSTGNSLSVSKKYAINEVMKMTPEERVLRAKDVLSSRILSDLDFRRIDAIQAAKKVEIYSASRKRGTKRPLEEEEKSDSEVVSLSKIEMVHKKRRHDLGERLRTVLEGREGREKFGSKKGRMNPHASTTNREKRKVKNFMMMKHKIRASKNRLSFREKQMKLKRGLLKAKLK